MYLKGKVVVSKKLPYKLRYVSRKFPCRTSYGRYPGSYLVGQVMVGIQEVALDNIAKLNMKSRNVTITYSR